MSRATAAIGCLLATLVAASVRAQAPPPAGSEPAAAAAPAATDKATRRLIERFQLFPSAPKRTCCDLSARDATENKRLLHQPGDPDSLFTLGSPTPQGELRLQAAVEVNEVILRALAPDLRVDPSDTRSRAAGDYRALDATGRPYQLRLGAKLVW